MILQASQHRHCHRGSTKLPLREKNYLCASMGLAESLLFPLQPMKQEQIILLRGVMPSGKNSIPKMAILRQQLEEAGFEAVRTYIQSGNILLRSELSAEALSIRIHDLLAEHYGADIAALVFRPEEIQGWIDACPFPSDLDPSRVFFTMTMERPDVQRLQVLAEKSWGEAELHLSEQCLYVHAPITYKNSRLTNNALERHLKVTCTTRNLNTLRRILALVTQDA